MKYYFSRIRLDIPENVYCPAEDSELLAEAISAMDISGLNVLDMGTGSGFLAILMSKKNAIVTAADLDTVAAMKNAQKNKASVNFIVSDLFSKVNGKFGLIVFNPPYLPKEDRYFFSDTDGGKSGKEVLESFVPQASRHLSDKGKILIVFSSLTGEKELKKLFHNNNFRTRIIRRKKIDWEELIVLEASHAA